MANRLGDGRQFRLLDVLDDFDRGVSGHGGRLFAARRTRDPKPGSDHRVARQEGLDQHIIETIEDGARLRHAMAMDLQQ